MLSYMRHPPVATAGALSVVVHGALILSAVIGTRPPASMATNGLANRIFYIPPPNRPPTASGGHATVHYITLAQGLGAGPGRCAAINPNKFVVLARRRRCQAMMMMLSRPHTTPSTSSSSRMPVRLAVRRGDSATDTTL
jgi:hypothetical protein